MTETNINQEVETLFKLGAHLGHKKNRLHPKAKKNLYSMIDGVSIIDLPITVNQLNKARKVLSEAAAEGKTALFVGTKKVASTYMSTQCKQHEIPAVTTKWLPGLMTNFDTIIKNVQKMRQMNEEKVNGTWDQYVKHERTKKAKELIRLEKLYGGMIHLTRKPDVIVIIDVRKEKNAVNEAKMNGIPVVAIVDTNANPDDITYPVVANDDAAPVVEYILQAFIDAYVKGQGEQKKVVPTELPSESNKTVKLPSNETTIKPTEKKTNDTMVNKDTNTEKKKTSVKKK